MARKLCNSCHDVTIWSVNKKEIQFLSFTRQHKNLPNCEIPEGIYFTEHIKEACDGKNPL